MSKYIIDTETWANLFEVKSVGVYGIGNDIVTDEKTVWSRMFSLDELEELNSNYINENFGELQDEAYQAGLNDAWEAARKIVADTDRGGFTLDALREIFGTQGFFCIMQDNTAQEAIDKIKAYEEKELHVGDEVIAPRGKAIVTALHNNFVNYLYSDGDCGCTEPENLTKTGRHYDIQSILEAMRK